MSSPGPGQTFTASIEIDGPKKPAQFRNCLKAVRKALGRCGGRLVTQRTVVNPLKQPKKK